MYPNLFGLFILDDLVDQILGTPQGVRTIVSRFRKHFKHVPLGRTTVCVNSLDAVSSVEVASVADFFCSVLHDFRFRCWCVDFFA